MQTNTEQSLTSFELNAILTTNPKALTLKTEGAECRLAGMSEQFRERVKVTWVGWSVLVCKMKWWLGEGHVASPKIIKEKKVPS